MNNALICWLENILIQYKDMFDLISFHFSPCMNSNSLFTTVFKNFQCALRKRGYWPTMYMMLDAIMALLSFPLFCSHRPSRSYTNTHTEFKLALPSCLDATVVYYFHKNGLNSIPHLWKITNLSEYLLISWINISVSRNNIHVKPWWRWQGISSRLLHALPRWWSQWPSTACLDSARTTQFRSPDCGASQSWYAQCQHSPDGSDRLQKHIKGSL